MTRVITNVVDQGLYNFISKKMENFKYDIKTLDDNYKEEIESLISEISQLGNFRDVYNILTSKIEPWYMELKYDVIKNNNDLNQDTIKVFKGIDIIYRSLRLITLFLEEIIYEMQIKNHQDLNEMNLSDLLMNLIFPDIENIVNCYFKTLGKLPKKNKTIEQIINNMAKTKELDKFLKDYFTFNELISRNMILNQVDQEQISQIYETEIHELNNPNVPDRIAKKERIIQFYNYAKNLSYDERDMITKETHMFKEFANSNMMNIDLIEEINEHIKEFINGSANHLN